MVELSNSETYVESAPGKIILFGEHAVVYGIPAIAVPLSDLRVKVRWSKKHTDSLQIVATDLKNQNISLQPDMSNVNNPLSRVFIEILKYYDAPTPSGYIEIKSDIPIASGLGSGAAVSAALGRTIARILGHTISDDVLNQIVFEVEKIHHGTPSGIDNTVIVYEKAIRFQKEHSIQSLSIDTPFNILIGDTGIPAPTHEAVGDVRKLYEADKDKTQMIFDKIEGIVTSAINHIKTGSIAELGILMVQNHKLLQELTVSSPKLDLLVKAALDAGALGAKLSGGGRGGNMIALVQDDRIDAVTNSMLSAGANRVFKTIVK